MTMNSFVIRAFSHLPSAEFEAISNEDDTTIGSVFGDFVAVHAQDNAMRLIWPTL